MSIANKFFYQSVDITTMITTGTKSLTGYDLTYNPVSEGYKQVDVGFTKVYIDGKNDLSGLGIEAVSTSLTGDTSFNPPQWCNAIKIYMETKSGQQGGSGNAGQAGQDGADAGRGGDGHTQTQKFQGGEGGNKGFGGAGGLGGLGGAGGQGVLLYTSNIIDMSNFTSPKLIANFGQSECNFTIENSNSQTDFSLTATNGLDSQSGALGKDGGQGQSGQAGGQAQGQANNNAVGAPGQDGAQGQAGANGGNGQNGAGSNNYNNVAITQLPASVTADKIVVYYFRV